MPEEEKRLLLRLPTGLRDIVSAKVADAQGTLGQRIGAVIDDAMGAGWTYDKAADEFAKDGDRVMVKVVWRALVEERG